MVAVGGAAGAVLRYLLTAAAVAIPGGSTLWGTSVSNLLGCAAIGAVMEYSLVEGAISPRLAMAIRVGFIGSLTTFSTLTAESLGLAQSGRMLAAGVYVGINLIVGWVLLWGAAALVKGWMA